MPSVPSILQTGTGTGLNITTEAVVATYTATSAYELVLASFRLSNLNGAAATLTVVLQHLDASNVLQREQYFTEAKRTTTATVYGSVFQPWPIMQGEKLTIHVKSSNASDTNAGWQATFYDAISANTVAQNGATVGLPVAGPVIGAASGVPDPTATAVHFSSAGLSAGVYAAASVWYSHAGMWFMASSSSVIVIEAGKVQLDFDDDLSPVPSVGDQVVAFICQPQTLMGKPTVTMRAEDITSIRSGLSTFNAATTSVKATDSGGNDLATADTANAIRQSQLAQQASAQASEAVDLSDINTVFSLEAGNLTWTTTAATTPATLDGDLVCAWSDSTNNGIQFSKVSSGAAPPLSTNAAPNGAPSLLPTASTVPLHATGAELDAITDSDYWFGFVLRLPDEFAGDVVLAKGLGLGDNIDRVLFRTQSGAIQRGQNGAGLVGPTLAVGQMAFVLYTFRLTGTNTGTESFYLDGKLFSTRTGAVPAVNTVDDWSVFGSTAIDGNEWNKCTAEVFNIRAGTGSLTQEQIDRLCQDVRQRFGGEVVIPFGDSYPAGVGADPAETYGWAYVMQAMLGIPSYAYANAAIGGKRIDELEALLPTAVAPYAWALNKRNTMVFQAGHNDAGQGADAATIFARFQSFAAAWRTTPINKLVVAPFMGTTNYAFTVAEAYRDLLKAAEGVDYDLYLPFDESILWDANAVSDPTLYDGAGVHPINRGHAILASIAVPTMRLAPGLSTDVAGALADVLNEAAGAHAAAEDAKTSADTAAANAEDAKTAAEANSALGPGSDSVTVTITRDDGTPIPDADVWITSDSTGATVVAGTLQTDSNGRRRFLLDAGDTYYLWMQADGENPIEGRQFTAVADA